LLQLWTGVPAPLNWARQRRLVTQQAECARPPQLGGLFHSLPSGPRLGITLEPSFQCAMRQGVAHYINVGSQCPFL
jgi:hypothetical protein